MMNLDLYLVQVNGELWDLERPLEGDCTLELLKFEDELGKQTSLHTNFGVLVYNSTVFVILF